MKPLGNIQRQTASNQRQCTSLPRHNANADTQATSSINEPIPTMMRKAKNTGVTDGRSLAGTDVSGAMLPSGRWVRIRLPRRGIATS